MINKRYRAELALFSNAVIWGGTFVIIKSALEDISPMMFLGSRFIFASLIILPFVLKQLKGATKSNYREGIILGIFLFIGFAAQTAGLKYTTATKSAFITGTFVVFTPLFQTLLEKRIPSIANIFGIVLVFLGISFLSSKSGNFLSIFTELAENFNFADFLTLICAIFYAVYIVYLDMISTRIDYKFLTFIQIFVTAILAYGSAFLLGAGGIETVKFDLSLMVIVAILYTSVLATVLTTALQTKFQRDVSPTKASLLFSMEPIFAAIFAFFLLSEKISIFGLTGCALIFGGIIISEISGKD